MDATSTTTAKEPSPMRQSCDRCHKQKLRCTREGSTNSGACDKCIRKRAQCIYSFALPKGRPSRYRIEGAPSNLYRPEPSQPTPVSSVPEIDQRAVPTPSSSPSPSPSPKLVSRAQLPTLGDNGGTEEHEHRAAAPSTSIPGLELSDPSLTAQDSDMGNWEWNGVASLTQDHLNWHPSVQTAACGDASTFGIAAFASLLNQPMMGDRAVDELQRAPASNSSQPISVDGGLGMGNESLVESDTGLDLPHTKFDPDHVIAELSKLSARLSTLRRSCYNIVAALEGPTTACPGLPQPLLHEVNFEVACHWLAHGPQSVASLPNAPSLDAQSNGSESKEVSLLLHEVYTASHLLLEILRSLQANLYILSLAEYNSHSTPSTTSSESSYFQIHTGQVSPSLSLLQSLSAPFRQSLVTPDSTSPSDGNGVIHHLVMACHTMLLTIYIAVLLILDRETDFSILTNAPVLRDIRLVSIVQTCSYLIKRLHQSMDSYLPLQPASHSLSAPNPKEAMTDIRRQIKDLLERIEGRLRL